MKDLKALPEKLLQIAETSKQYLPLLFLLLLLAIYGFLFLQVRTLNAQEPSAADVTAKSRTASVPHIDQKVLDQVQSLQDNSVSVQTLFVDARSNPFN